MKAIQLTAPRLDAFQPTHVPTPEPQRGEVLVRLRAASLNYIDLAVATGNYPARLPLIPVSDGAGEIAAVGEDVSGFSVGDRVAAHAKLRWIGGRPRAWEMHEMRGLTTPGSLAEYVALPANAVLPAPPSLGFEAAATLPIVATTAWNALSAARIGPGSTVLLLGTGGVSLMALQLAKALNARVIITSSSDDKLARAKALGADELVNYRDTPAWDEAVLKLTGGEGVDLVVETGGAATYARSLNAAAPGGTVFTVGFLGGVETSMNLLPVITKALRIVGNNTGSVDDLRAALRVIGACQIQPVIDQVFAPGQAAQAYGRLASGGHFGKVAFKLDW